MTNWPARIAVIIACTVITLLGLGTAGAFICYAVFAFLTKVMAPPYAALCVAAIVVLITALLLGFVLLLAKIRDEDDEPEDGAGLLGLQLSRFITGDMVSLIARNPKAALITAIAGGLLVGVSPRIRQTLLDLLRR